jgi:hypothetical protein
MLKKLQDEITIKKLEERKSFQNVLRNIINYSISVEIVEIKKRKFIFFLN